MDTKALKLELLERIALLDDEDRLLALKRLLDAPRGYGIPNENLSVVKEGEGSFDRLEDRSYSAEEVRALFDKLQRATELEDLQIDEDEIALLDARRERHLRGEGRSFSIEEVLSRLKADLGE